ncbi:MAG: rod shape-determining protein [Clostridiales bacterium]|jgi:rod shape-determining protein MreB|nr:rod shape-determining protein [Clostridiales bacterium]
MPTIDFAIELGTGNTSVYLRGNGIVLKEPTVIAFLGAVRRKFLRAVGKDAARIVGKSPSGTLVISPVEAGIVVDPEAAVVLLNEFLRKCTPQAGVFSYKLRALVPVPDGLTGDERRTLMDVLLAAGVEETVLIETSLCAAVGAHLPVRSTYGGAVINIGAGTTEIACLSAGGIAHGGSLNVGGKSMDAAVAKMVERVHKLQVGLPTAERIKLEVGSMFENDNAEIVVSGTDTVSKSPSSALVKSPEVFETLLPFYNRIAETVESFIKKCPPELASDIYRTGVHLTGGGAQVPGLKKLLSARLKLPVHIPENSEYACILGAGELLNDRDLLDALLVS